MARLRIKDDKLLKKLKPPRNPKGGWLPPNPKALQKFYDKMQEEAIRLFGVDEDNDACVLVRLIDNSREESNVLNFNPIPRDIEESPYHPYGKQKWTEERRDPTTKKYITPKHTPEEEETRRKAILENRFWIQRMVGLNFSLAAERLQQLVRDAEFELRDKIDAPEKQRAARIKTLEHKKEWWKDPIKSLRDSGYIVDEEKGVYWYHKDDGLDNQTRIKPIPVKPADFDTLMAELERLKKYKPAKKLSF